MVVSLLDLAPFELPEAYQRSAAARFGQRLRSRLLHDAASVIVSGEATARQAIRLLHLHRERLDIVPLAAAPVFRPLADVPGGAAALAAERARLGLPDRYVVFFGRYDARRDLGTLMEALEKLRAMDRPAELADGDEWPPRLLLVGANPNDRSALARAAERWGVGDLLSYAPFVDQARLGLLVAGARLAVVPALSEATGLAALEALAAGTPVAASAVGALPEVIGAAGILVEPRDPGRLAAALEALWVDGRVHDRIADAVARRLREPRRTWADVARETRAIYARVASNRSTGA
jgi:glycosyltransferase involved in cell wall biosynthesis